MSKCESDGFRAGTWFLVPKRGALIALLTDFGTERQFWFLDPYLPTQGYDLELESAPPGAIAPWPRWILDDSCRVWERAGHTGWDVRPNPEEYDTDTGLRFQDLSPIQSPLTDELARLKAALEGAERRAKQLKVGAGVLVALSKLGEAIEAVILLFGGTSSSAEEAMSDVLAEVGGAISTHVEDAFVRRAEQATRHLDRALRWWEDGNEVGVVKEIAAARVTLDWLTSLTPRR